MPKDSDFEAKMAAQSTKLYSGDRKPSNLKVVERSSGGPDQPTKGKKRGKEARAAYLTQGVERWYPPLPPASKEGQSVLSCIDAKFSI